MSDVLACTIVSRGWNIRNVYTLATHTKTAQFPVSAHRELLGLVVEQVEILMTNTQPIWHHLHECCQYTETAISGHSLTDWQSAKLYHELATLELEHIGRIIEGGMEFAGKTSGGKKDA